MKGIAPEYGLFHITYCVFCERLCFPNSETFQLVKLVKWRRLHRLSATSHYLSNSYSLIYSHLKTRTLILTSSYCKCHGLEDKCQNSWLPIHCFHSISLSSYFPMSNSRCNYIVILIFPEQIKEFDISGPKSIQWECHFQESFPEAPRKP